MIETSDRHVNSDEGPFLYFFCALIIAAAYALWWHWITAFPLQISSDDALNFSRAVSRFSVLEFRPHFPGYPAFVGLSRLCAIFVENSIAPIWVSLLSALLLPLLVSYLVLLLCHSKIAATGALLLTLIQPLLASMALSGLSDASAMVFFLLALIVFFKKRYLCVGLALALMLSTRPSYLPLSISLFVSAYFNCLSGSKWRTYLQMSVFIVLIGVISLLFIIAHDGLAYFDEGMRFTLGHFLIWGNTAQGEHNSLLQWFITLRENFGLLGICALLLVLPYSFYKGYKVFKTQQTHVDVGALCARQSALIALLATLNWAWISLAQNPDNVRHFGPILCLGIVLICTQIQQVNKYLTVFKWQINLGMTMALCLMLYVVQWVYPSYQKTVKLAPIQQAMLWLKKHPESKVLGSNYSVNLLRASMPGFSVYDMYYPSSTWALKKESEDSAQRVWQLSATKSMQQRWIAQFPPRFMGERHLFLYQISQ
ncbi:hypothetical protein PCNPT3_10065 [Psychromonas sp. CNPT3]|uniref:hypothetical protein n=1 Tax=Psychromonas sp. CNPT3 TaxID=314282 RepID=UPI00006E585C|nr:hypothetical protein [Psychromonas sp. CNPT3]AGH81951.1 hypothetical protein PCNPT3_10065 [Psychromonas sp. CNPT3]